jgi:hypothetical protein
MRLTRIRPKKSAIEGRENLYDPVMFAAVARFNQGHVNGSCSVRGFLWQAQKPIEQMGRPSWGLSLFVASRTRRS